MIKRIFALALITCVASIACAQLQSGSPWPKVHGNLQNTNEGLGAGVPTPYLEWAWGSSSDHCGPAVISADGTVYFSDTNNGIYSLVAVNSLTGATKWQTQLTGPIAGSPAIGSDGTIYVCSQQQFLAFTDTGPSARLKWSSFFINQLAGSPTIESNGDVVISDGGFLLGIQDSGSSGTVVWNAILGANIETSPAIGTDGSIYVGDDDDIFFAFDASGNELSNYQTSSTDAITQDSAIFPNGELLAVAGTALFYLSNPAALANNGTVSFGSVIGTPAVPSSSYYAPAAGFSGANDFIVNLPSQSWLYRAAGIAGSTSAVQATDGTLYFGSDELYSLTTDGSFNWSYPIEPNAPMAMDGNGTLYMPDTANGGFAAIGNPIPSFTLSSSSVFGGDNNPVVGTIQFAGSLTSQDIQGAQLSSSSSDVTFGSLTQVTGNTYQANFTTSAVTAPVTVTLGVSYLSSTTSATLTVNPVNLEQIRLEPTSEQGGQRAAVAFYLFAPAPAGGITVNVASSSTDAVFDSNTISIPHGAQAGNVLIHTLPVSSEEAINITGTYNGITLHRILTLEPAALTGIKVGPTTVLGGANSQLAVYLNGKAGATGDSVTLSSSSPDVTVPGSLSVASGATDANVTIQTAPVSSSEQVTLSATFGSTTLQTTINLTPAVLSGINVTKPGSVIGGFPTQLAVYLNGRAGVSGAFIIISSSSPDASVSDAFIYQGSGSTNVGVSTAPVDATEQITITATYGSVTLNTNLTLNPAALNAVQLQPAGVEGGNSSAFAVYLNGPAGPSGTVLTLSSNSSDATVPATVTIPAGATSANVHVLTVPVSAAEQVTISATLGGKTLTKQLTISP
ncbi:MAG TPA: PQQ-binding-like beta-propeller repeat protein [Fimbriimonadaceae bacterium]